jgi:ferredoxin
VLYADVVAALGTTGLVARGGFEAAEGDAVQSQADGSPTRTVVVIGNVGGAMWSQFRSAEEDVDDPLDTWTRSVLEPIATSLGACFVHPSDEPFQPFQRWAQRAEGIVQSPIGLLIHPRYGLWHAYRGAFLFPFALAGLPLPLDTAAPCLTCDGQPCLDACPVGAFTLASTLTGTPARYDADACRGHVRSGRDPRCIDDGCAARCACPVGVEFRYGPDQMRFHMQAFVGA